MNLLPFISSDPNAPQYVQFGVFHTNNIVCSVSSTSLFSTSQLSFPAQIQVNQYPSSQVSHNELPLPS